MAMTINTNLVSMNAQRNASASQSSLATSMQRLSSGLRVNSAKDDAAGLAILPGLVRYDEVYGAGEITHAFRFSTRATRLPIASSPTTLSCAAPSLPRARGERAATIRSG